MARHRLRYAEDPPYQVGIDNSLVNGPPWLRDAAMAPYAALINAREIGPRNLWITDSGVCKTAGQALAPQQSGATNQNQ